MEDVLDLYAEPYDPQRPVVVCFDETSTQLLADVREPLPAKPGRPRREDYEYARAGTRNLFLTCDPKAGWRHVAITQRRTMQDFAHQMRWLVDEAYPYVPVIRLVPDNLNTRRMASLYETFPAPEARRIAKRLEFHYTPKHGSRLNMWVGVMRGRAKPWGRFLRGPFRSGAPLPLAAGLWPGILEPRPPPLDNWASKPSTRRRSSVMIPCCSAMTASRVSRLALVRSSPVSIVLLCHNQPTGASVFQRNRRPGKFASSSLNSYGWCQGVDAFSTTCLYCLFNPTLTLPLEGEGT